jgi:antibiotic biosynthesis monooxygenase (ABM) superfamily enzyme
LDEAYLEIQKRLEEKDVAFKRERFVYLYIIIVLFDGLILSIADIKAFSFFLLATLILAIALAHWLEFPWIVTDLRVWLNKLHKDRKLSSDRANEIEP